MVLLETKEKLLGYVPTVVICILCSFAVLFVCSNKIFGTPNKSEESKIVDETDLMNIAARIEDEQGEEIYNSISIEDEDIIEAKNSLPSTLYYVSTSGGTALLEQEYTPGTRAKIYDSEYDILLCREATDEDKSAYVKYSLEYCKYVEEIMERAREEYAKTLYK